MTAEAQCAVAGAGIVLLALALLVPQWVVDFAAWVRGDAP